LCWLGFGFIRNQGQKREERERTLAGGKKKTCLFKRHIANTLGQRSALQKHGEGNGKGKTPHQAVNSAQRTVAQTAGQKEKAQFQMD